MTDTEWLTCPDPITLLGSLGRPASPRKLRLFAAACCRRVLPWLWTRSSEHAILVAERYADASADLRELADAQASVRNGLELFPGEPVYDASYWACGSKIEDDVGWCSTYARNCSTRQVNQHASDVDARSEEVAAKEEFEQRRLFHDIFANPFRPQPLNPAWLSWNDGTIRRLAEGIYADRAFDRLPILADALEEAGCDNADMLAHCRSEGPHVRGCWVVDLLLGKE